MVIDWSLNTHLLPQFRNKWDNEHPRFGMAGSDYKDIEEVEREKYLPRTPSSAYNCDPLGVTLHADDHVNIYCDHSLA